MERLQQMDRLESQLERGSFRPDDVDRSLAQELLGDEARQAIDQLRKLTDVLEKAGYVEKKGRRMELTPRGMRRIGQSALRDIFDQLKKTRMGQHQLSRGGLGNDASDELKDYEYGDPVPPGPQGDAVQLPGSRRAEGAREDVGQRFRRPSHRAHDAGVDGL